MHAELQCKFCPATTPEVNFEIASVESEHSESPGTRWTWWEQTEVTTCPAHYADGLAREREARRASDA